MSVIVLSCGRTGTNVALEILRGNSQLNASSVPENKKLTKPPKKYPDNYLTKCDTIYFTINELDELLKLNPEMKVVWTIRDPRDVIMSKIFRGQPNTEGRRNWTSADGTPENAIKDLRDMKTKFDFMIKNYSSRILLTKLESMIANPSSESKKFCDFLNIKFEEEMIDFPKRMRNKHKVKRYGKEIHFSQVRMWKRVKTVYDGFFTKQKYDIEKAFEEIEDLIVFFEY